MLRVVTYTAQDRPVSKAPAAGRSIRRISTSSVEVSFIVQMANAINGRDDGRQDCLHGQFQTVLGRSKGKRGQSTVVHVSEVFVYDMCRSCRSCRSDTAGQAGTFKDDLCDTGCQVPKNASCARSHEGSTLPGQTSSSMDHGSYRLATTGKSFFTSDRHVGGDSTLHCTPTKWIISRSNRLRG